MPAIAPNILALDFDGVLCNGLEEYFLTAWRTYCQVWEPASQEPTEDLALVFYRLRPVIETGLQSNPNQLSKALCKMGRWKKTTDSSFESAPAR